MHFVGRLARNFRSLRSFQDAHPLYNLSRHLRVSCTCYDTIQLKMPSLSPTMEQGTIVKWYKKEGDPIAPGDQLCDIQTDKAVVGFEVEEEGILAKILKPENSSDIKIGVPIALMVEEGEDWQNVEIPADIGDAGPAEGATPAQEEYSSVTTAGGGAVHSYGPAVRSLLEIYNINSVDVTATGPHERLLKGDVLRFIRDKGLKPAPVGEVTAPPPPTAPAAPAAPPPPAAPVPQAAPLSTPVAPLPAVPATDTTEYEDLPLTGMRQVIAKRLTESKTTIPHAYASIDCNMIPVMKLRKTIADEGVKVSVNDFIVKTAAVALQRVPQVNAMWSGEGPQYLQNIDISVAVATPSGLITPIIKDAIGLGVEEISRTIKEMAGRAREGKLKPEEYQGGSFTISNLGMFGITEFSAVINPPQACILAIGTSRLVPDSEGNPQTKMIVTLASDGRIVDDSLAAEFLQVFREIMENPMLMLSQGVHSGSQTVASV